MFSMQRFIHGFPEDDLSVEVHGIYDEVEALTIYRLNIARTGLPISEMEYELTSSVR